MNFAELLAFVALFVGTPWAVFSGIAKVKAAKGLEGASLKTSELEAIVRRAVDNATEPLRRRLEAVEAIVTDDDPADRRAGRLDPAALADAFDPVELDAPAAVGRRTRG